MYQMQTLGGGQKGWGGGCSPLQLRLEAVARSLAQRWRPAAASEKSMRASTAVEGKRKSVKNIEGEETFCAIKEGHETKKAVKQQKRQG